MPDESSDEVRERASGKERQYGRALLTDNERAIQTGEADADDHYRWKTESAIRNRIKDELPADLEILAQHHPRAYDLVIDLVAQHLDGELRGGEAVAEYELSEEAVAAGETVGLFRTAESGDDAVHVVDEHAKPGRYYLVRAAGGEE